MTTQLRNWFSLWMGAVLCLCYLLPNHYSPWLSVHQELGAALAFTPVLIWAAFKVRWVPVLAYAAAALSLVPVLQMLCGQLSFASDGWMGVLYVMGFALTVHAGARCSASTSAGFQPVFTSLIWPWTGLLLAALVSVGIQIYQWLLLGNQGIYVAELPPNWRPFGNLAQPNQLATLLLLGMAGVLMLWESAKLRSGIALAAAFMLTFGLVMTGSRSVLLTLVWLLPAYVLLRHRCNLRTTPGAMAALLGFYAITSLSWGSINEWLLLRVDVNTAVERMSGLGIRKVFWVSMMDAVTRAPWGGYGWGKVGSAQTLTALEYPATYSFFDSAHNFLIDIALWNGLPVAVMVALVLVLWFGWQIYRCRDGLSFAVLTAICVVFSHAMVEFPLHYAYFLLPVGFWMGALSAVHPSPLDCLKPGRSLPVLRRVVATISGAVLILFVTVVVEYFPFEEDWRLMQFQEKRIGDLAHTEPPPAIILTGLHEFLKFSRTEPEPGMSEQDIEWMRRVSERYAYASPMYRYARAQALNHRADGAQQTLRRLCRMQTEAACESARDQWNELRQNRDSPFANIPFPADIPLKH